MATYEVTAPDGRAFEIEAPDGASQEQIIQYAQQNFNKETQPKKYEGWGEYLSDASRTGLGQGLALGFGDEITAGVKSLVSGKSYDDALKEERDALKRFQAHNPATAFGLTLAGGAVLPFGAVRGAATALGTAVRSAKVGAGYGAVTGFGSSEGSVDNRLTGAGQGAAVGGALGAVMPSAILAGRAGYGKVRDAALPQIISRRRGPEAAADHILARRLSKDGRVADDVATDLEAGREAARFHSNSRVSLPETLADTSDDMQRLAGSVYRQGGEGGSIMRSALDGRQRGPANPLSPQPGEFEGQHAEITEAVRRALTVESKGTALANDRMIMRQQRLDGNKLYRDAYKESQAFDVRPDVESFVAKAAEYPKPFRARLTRAANLFRDPKLQINSVRRFDAAKKELDDMIDTAARQGRGNLARELTEFKQSLLDRVHAPDQSGNATRNMKYDEARRAWGSAAENREAIDLGRNALKDSSEVTAENFRQLTEGQQKLFRIGFMNSVRHALGRKRPGNDSTLLFQEPRVIELLSTIIPNSKGRGVFANRSERLGDYLGRQQRMVDTRNKVLGGSPTSQRHMDDARGVGDMLSGVMSGFRGGTNAALEFVAFGLNKAFGYSSNVSKELAKRLASVDPAEQSAILDAIKREMNADQFRVFTQHLSDRLTQSSGALGVATGQAMAIQE